MASNRNPLIRFSCLAEFPRGTIHRPGRRLPSRASSWKAVTQGQRIPMRMRGGLTMPAAQLRKHEFPAGNFIGQGAARRVNPGQL